MAFQRAKRSFTPLLVGLGGMTGSGKTYSALRLAAGLSGNGRIAFCDTERGRALHYADRFAFDHDMIEPPFTPERYQEMIERAEAHVGEGGCIVIDSMSHLWEGPGGLLETASNKAQEMAERASKSQNRYVGPDVYTFPSWREPKQRNQKLVNRILQLRCHAIFCFRAKEKMKLTKNDRGKQEIVSQGVQPIMEEGFPYEMTLFAMLNADRPGVPDFHFKALAEQFHGLFNGKPLDEGHGKKLAEWAGAVGPSSPELADDTGANGDTRAESIIVHFPNNNGGKDMEYRDLAEAGQRLTAYAENAIARKAFANVRAVIAANEQLMERAPAIRNVLMALLGDEATGPRDEGVKVADGQEAML